MGARVLVKTNMLADRSRRPGLLTMGLCTVAATASMLGAVVALMLSGSVPEAGQPMAASETASPDAMASLDPAFLPEIPAPAEPAAASAVAALTVPATASIGAPAAAGRAAGATTARLPLDDLPLDLGPRVVHALAALEPTGFMVHAGAFVSESHAATLAETIAAVAASVRLTPFVNADGRGGWMVSAGPFADAATATATAADIRRLVGVDPQVRALEPSE